MRRYLSTDVGNYDDECESRIPLLGKGGVVGSTTDYRMLDEPPRRAEILGCVAFCCSARRPLLCQGGEFAIHIDVWRDTHVGPQ